MKRIITYLMMVVLFGGSLAAQSRGNYGIRNDGNTRFIVTQRDLPSGSVFSGIKSSAIVSSEVAIPAKDGFFIKKKSAQEDVATIVFLATNVYGDGTGFQFLLDADCNVIENMSAGLYEENPQDLFDDCEIKKPENASADFSNPGILINEQITFNIPEGVYDFIIMNPDPYQMRYFVYYSEEDFAFEAGYVYEFRTQNAGLELLMPEDASLTEVILPGSSLSLTANEDIKVVIGNPGKHDISSFDVSYSVNGELKATETYTGTIQPGKTATYTFNAKADFSAVNKYVVEATVIYGKDMNKSNNTQSAMTRKYAPVPLPFVENFSTEDDLISNWENFQRTEYLGRTFHFNPYLPGADMTSGMIECNFGAYQIGSLDSYIVSNPVIFPQVGDYNLTFHIMALGKHSFRVLYGTTPEPDEMQVLIDYPTIPLYFGWELYVANFTLDVPGDYYFAFHVYSYHEGSSSFCLDQIKIEEGLYSGTLLPDIAFSSALLPVPSCALADEVLGATIVNQGTKTITEVTLSYQVGSAQPVEQTFAVNLIQKGMTSVYFDQKADLSGPGNHSIVFTASTPDETAVGNNTTTVTAMHLAPITELPFTNDFKVQDDQENWISIRNDWGYYPFDEAFLYPAQINSPLTSRCLALAPGEYRLDYTYRVGGFYNGEIYTDDFYVAFGKSGTDPMSWEPLKVYINGYTGGMIADDHIMITITEEDEYVIAFVGTRGQMHLHSTSFDLIPAHDIRIKDLSYPSYYSRLTPQYQVKGNNVFELQVENRGLGEETGQVILNGTPGELGSIDFTVASGATKPLSFDVSLDNPPLGELNLQFTVQINSNDKDTSDNMLEFTTLVTDSIFAHDYVDRDFAWGIGANGQPVSFGLIFELAKPDILTSISVGFIQMQNKSNVGLAVYPMNDNDGLGTPLVEIEAPRTDGGGEAVVYDVPHTELAAGRYFFELRQLDIFSVGVACDYQSGGSFYEHFNGRLYYTPNFGYIHIRPNFGKAGVGIEYPSVGSSSLKLYPNPASDILTIETPGGEINEITVYTPSGTTIYKERSLRSSQSTINVSRWAQGLYILSLRTNSGILNSKFIVK